MADLTGLFDDEPTTRPPADLSGLFDEPVATPAPVQAKPQADLSGLFDDEPVKLASPDAILAQTNPVPTPQVTDNFTPTESAIEGAFQGLGATVPFTTIQSPVQEAPNSNVAGAGVEQFVRPVARGILARGAGTVAGGALAGPKGAFAGATTAAIVDRAAQIEAEGGLGESFSKRPIATAIDLGIHGAGTYGGMKTGAVTALTAKKAIEGGAKKLPEFLKVAGKNAVADAAIGTATTAADAAQSGQDFVEAGKQALLPNILVAMGTAPFGAHTAVKPPVPLRQMVKAGTAQAGESPIPAPKVPETASNEVLGASQKPSAAPKADPELAKADQFMNFKRTRFSPETETTVRKRIVEWAKANGEDPKQVESLDEIAESAANVGLSKDFIESELKPAAKDGISRAKLHAARTTHTELSEKYAEAQSKLDAQKTTMAPAEIEAAEADLSAMRGDLTQLEDVILPARTAAGRNLRALAMEVGLTTDPARQIAKAKKIKGAELTQEEYDKLQQLTKIYNGAKKGKDQAAIRAATGELVKFHQGLQRTDYTTAAGMTIKAAMLTGMKTIGRNIGSNTAHQALMGTENAIAGPVDWALSLMTGKRTKLAPWEMRDTASTMLEAARRSKNDIADTFKYGAPVGQLEQMLKKYDVPRGMNTGHKIWDTAVNSVFRATAAQDVPHWHFAYLRGIEEQARLIAINEKRAGKLSMPYEARVKQIIQKPDTKQQLNAMVVAAEKVADRATFKGKNKLADAIGGFKSALRSGGTGAKIGALATDIVMPFEKVPTNIAKEVGSRAGYSQAGAAFKGIPVVAKAAMGKLSPDEQKAFSEMFAKAGTGTGLIALGWVLGSKGLATGTYEHDQGRRDRDELAGRQPESIEIAGKFRKVSDVATPVGTLISLGATLQREFARTDIDGGQRATNLGVAAMDTVLDLPLMTGAKNALRVQEPGGLPRFLSTTATMPIPTIVGDVAAVFDGKRRDAKTYPGEGVGTGVKRALMQEIPFLRSQLPPRLNSAGKEQSEPWTNLFDPAIPKEKNNTPYVRELVRLDVPLPRIEKKKMETREQYQQRQIKVGEMLEQKLGGYVASDAFKKLPTDQQRHALKEVASTVYSTMGILASEAVAAEKREKLQRQLPSLFKRKSVNDTGK